MEIVIESTARTSVAQIQKEGVANPMLKTTNHVKQQDKVRNAQRPLIKPSLLHTSTTQSATMDVKDIVSIVNAEFKKHDENLEKLAYKVHEREQELSYCQSETKKQIEKVCISTSAIAFQTQSLDSCKRDFGHYQANSESIMLEELTFMKLKVFEGMSTNTNIRSQVKTNKLYF